MFRSIAGGLACIIAILSTAVFAQEPLPEFFGVYALQDGKLIELNEDAELNDFSSTVRFIIYMRGLELAQPMNKMFFIPPDKPKETGSQEFKGWDDFYKQSQAFSSAFGKRIEYDVPANAQEIPFRIGPYGENKEMMRVVPVKELPPGYYQLLKGIRFWVKRAEVAHLYVQNSTTPVAGKSTGQAAVSNTVSYPISSGSNLWTKFGIRNQTFRPIQVYLDGSDKPFEVRLNYQSRMEVGSTHIIKVVVGDRAFERKFIVPQVMRDIRVTAKGIEIQ